MEKPLAGLVRDNPETREAVKALRACREGRVSNQPSAHIRAMTPGDFPALEELYYDFHEYHARGVPTHLLHMGERDAWDRAPLRAALEKVLADENARVFVAEVEECLAGLIEIYVRRDPESPAVVPGRYAELQSLMVAAPFRRQRVAWRLVRHAAAWAREKGATEIRLHVWEFNAAALRLYEQMGFRTLQRRMAIKLDEVGPEVSIRAAPWGPRFPAT